MIADLRKAINITRNQQRVEFSKEEVKEAELKVLGGLRWKLRRDWRLIIDSKLVNRRFVVDSWPPRLTGGS